MSDSKNLFCDEKNICPPDSHNSSYQIMKIIKRHLDSHMSEIIEYKQKFTDSVDKGIPSFEDYLIFFNFMKTVFKSLGKFNTNHRFNIFIADDNNKVLFINKLHNNVSSIQSITEKNIFYDFYIKYINGSLYTLSENTKKFLNIIQEKKSNKWLINRTLISRYTPSTISIEQINDLDDKLRSYGLTEDQITEVNNILESLTEDQINQIITSLQETAQDQINQLKKAIGVAVTAEKIVSIILSYIALIMDNLPG